MDRYPIVLTAPTDGNQGPPQSRTPRMHSRESSLCETLFAVLDPTVQNASPGKTQQISTRRFVRRVLPICRRGIGPCTLFTLASPERQWPTILRAHNRPVALFGMMPRKRIRVSSKYNFLEFFHSNNLSVDKLVPSVYQNRSPAVEIPGQCRIFDTGSPLPACLSPRREAFRAPDAHLASASSRFLRILHRPLTGSRLAAP